MPKAIKVTEEYITDIVAWASTLGRDLSYLRDNFEFYAEEGEELWVVADPDWDSTCRTITDMSGSAFRQSWKIVDQEMDGHFNKIERI